MASKSPKKSLSAKKSPPPKACPPPKASPPKACPPPKASPPKVEHDAASNALTSYAEERMVPFGKLRSNDNVRRIRDAVAQEELNAAIGAEGAQDRMEVYEAPDGTFIIQKGSRRHIALANAGYKEDDMISVLVRPAPRTRGDDRLTGLKSNLTAEPMAWPDIAAAIGEAVGVIDRFGNVRSNEEIREARASGEHKTAEEVAIAIGKTVDSVNRYVRTARAPYADLVQIYRAGGSQAHGETYAAYSEAQRPVALKHYLGTVPHVWPEAIVPERKRAPGGGRPTNASKGLSERTKAGQKKQRPEPPRQEGGAVWTSGPPEPAPPPPVSPATPPSAPSTPAPAPAAPSTVPEATRQMSLLDAPGPSLLRPGAPAKGGPRLAEDTAVLADQLGLPLDLVLFLDAVADEWDPAAPIEAWPKAAVSKIETAISVLQQSETVGEVFA